ncbi:MAG: type III-B CRISPR module RAMP protein Cmr4 [Candidatus Thorarchaeota archaeon]|nr:MAG: type III-B CRISPR module RAMP protein Cmr4 [Candidatus Thorarchaeota archaeon]
MENKRPYDSKVYMGMALDPIHVGTGGYRLGRVDLTIVREPATNIPKIPGTSIAGVARAYTAMQKGKYPDCAGKGGEQGEKHCGKPDCPVCVTYGFSKGEKGLSFQGLAQFSDARILFFPVATMVGPMWVTSPMRLEAAEVSPGNSQGWEDLRAALSSEGEEYFLTNSPHVNGDHLNLGWLYLPRSPKNETPGINPASWKIDDKTLSHHNINPDILKRIVIVSDKLFSHVVNDNLEVRTSVSIDPLTGAAESGALFTYEAIPRGTILWFEVVYNNPKLFKVPVKENGDTKQKEIKAEKEKNAEISWIRNNVEEGLKLFGLLGVGGMGTRGMGRLEVLNINSQKGE